MSIRRDLFDVLELNVRLQFWQKKKKPDIQNWREDVKTLGFPGTGLSVSKVCFETGEGR